MAGLLDDVMDGIAAKEKQTPPAQQPTTPPTTPTHEQAPTATSEAKPMNSYSDDFKTRYGDRKK